MLRRWGTVLNGIEGVRGFDDNTAVRTGYLEPVYNFNPYEPGYRE